MHNNNYIFFSFYFRASFASWLLMNLLIVVVPRYGAYQMVITGGLMLTTNFVYYLLIPAKPLMIRFEEHMLMFKFGWCFWLVVIAGIFFCFFLHDFQLFEDIIRFMAIYSMLIIILGTGNSTKLGQTWPIKIKIYHRYLILYPSICALS